MEQDQIKRRFPHGSISLSQELLDVQHIQSHYFLDMPQSSVIIFQTLFFLGWGSCPADLHLNNQLIAITSCLNVDFTPRVIFHLLVTLFEPLVPLKNMYAQHGIITMHLLNEPISSVYDRVFPTAPKISGLFVPQCS